jgi:hypothetical protein
MIDKLLLLPLIKQIFPCAGLSQKVDTLRDTFPTVLKATFRKPFSMSWSEDFLVLRDLGRAKKRRKVVSHNKSYCVCSLTSIKDSSLSLSVATHRISTSLRYTWLNVQLQRAADFLWVHISFSFFSRKRCFL